MKARNTTLQNRTKSERLDYSFIVPSHYVDSPEDSKFLFSLRELPFPKEQILYSIGVALLGRNRNPAIKEFLSEYSFDLLEIADLPIGSFDILGSAYQFLNSKSENLRGGIFYTGHEIATEFVGDLVFDEGQTILDPACGSGSFLFRSNAPSGQIFGVDRDPIAIMIAKFNYFLKFPNGARPNFFCEDFFSWAAANNAMKFDYVIANPPYGAELDLSGVSSDRITSGESFSLFLEYGYRLLSEKGILRYLMPEALLNVKRHSDVRSFLLSDCNLTRLKKYRSAFSGVMSDVFMVEVDHGDVDEVTFDGAEPTKVPKSIFLASKNKVLVELSRQDVAILDKVRALQHFDLSCSTFGLGVVTGNNREHLMTSMAKGAEPIYTGKEVHKFQLASPRNFLIFNRSRLQQVAPDSIYRAKSKLVYKTICMELRVAIDESGSLTTNSANLIIPNVPGYSHRTVMAFLNSDLYSYLHLKLFGGVNKVAKENLMELPFPKITSKQNRRIEELVDDVLAGAPDDSVQDFIQRQIFGLTDSEVLRVSSGSRPS